MRNAFFSAILNFFFQLYEIKKKKKCKLEKRKIEENKQNEKQ